MHYAGEGSRRVSHGSKAGVNTSVKATLLSSPCWAMLLEFVRIVLRNDGPLA